MKRLGVLILMPFLAPQALALDYRYEDAELSSEVFGNHDKPRLPPFAVDFGGMNLGVKPTLNCGKIGVNIDMEAQLKNLTDQFKGFVDHFRSTQFLLSLGMMELCNLYPKACAALRHDSLKLDNLLKARFDACQWIDNSIDSAAERGRQELRATAVKDCIESNVQGGTPTETAIQACQKEDGLPMKSFERWATGGTTRGSQLVLKSLVGLGRKFNDRHYAMYASLLGDIEVQPTGQWKPVFPREYLYPEDFVTKNIVLAQSCSTLENLSRGNRRDDPREDALRRVATKNLSPKWLQGLKRFSKDDQVVICNLLGKAVALEASRELAASLADVRSNTKLHPTVPTLLKNEVIERTEIVQRGILDAVANEGDMSVGDAKRMVATYGALLEARAKSIGTSAGTGATSNDKNKSDGGCVDEATCGR